MSDVRNVIIIGSGPAGYTAAIYAARASLNPLVVQGLQPGGQMTITTDVENYPGFADVIQGPWLMEQMKAQAEHVGTKIVNDIITHVDFDRRPFVLTSDSGTTYIYIFDLQSIHDDIKIDITKNVRENIENKGFILNSNWKEKLVDNPEILNSTDYFDYEYFLEKLKEFRTNIDIKYWNYIEVNHSNSRNKQDFRRTLLNKEIFPLKVSGLYAYFAGGKCIYIGKAKNIQNRLESHFLSSQNLDNLSRGAKHRRLFGKYLEENLTIFYKELDDTFHSQIGEELRTTIERLLHLKYKPEFIEIKNE